MIHFYFDAIKSVCGNWMHDSQNAVEQASSEYDSGPLNPVSQSLGRKIQDTQWRLLTYRSYSTVDRDPEK
jgi:hypothetical protein